VNEEILSPQDLPADDHEYMVPVVIPSAAELPQAVNASARKGPSFAYLVAALAGGNVVSSVLRILGGYLQALCVVPDVLGLFGRINLVQEYVRFAQIGIFNGLNRELPYFYGKGDQRRVAELASTALAWSLCLGTIVSVALAGVTAWFVVRGEWELAAAWGSNAVCCFVLFYAGIYLASTYRTAHDFARLSMVNVIQNVLAVLLVVLVAWFQFYGLCVRAVIAAVVGAVLLHYWRPIPVKPAWNWRQFGHLLWIGIPIFVVGDLLPQLWVTLDKQFVSNILGNNGMGLYSIVIVAGGTLEMLPAAVSQVIYPRMTQHYGKTGRLGEVLLMAVKPMLLTLAGMAPLAFIGWWLAEPLTRWLLPNYVQAVPAMKWALLPPLLSALVPIHNIYNVARRQDLDAVATLFGMGSYFTALWWLVRGGADLTAFPKAVLIGRAIQLISCYLLLIPLTAWAKKREGQSPK
jgi:O-antigen/teichoic acid export membrane protein